MLDSAKVRYPNSSNKVPSAALQPIKIAELVRQLAEAQYESKALREQIQSHHLQSNPFQRDVANPCGEKNPGDCTQCEAYSHVGGGLNTVDIGKPAVLQEGQDVQISEARGWTPNEMSISYGKNSCHTAASGGTKVPVQCGLVGDDELSTAAEDNPPNVGGRSLCNYWKKKYMRLKRFHEKAMAESAAQLQEVQLLVLKIGEEQDALHHRQELRIIQQKLENERNQRLTLEDHVNSLKEEVVRWKERYLHFLEEPAVHWYRTLATDMHLPAKCERTLGEVERLQQHAVSGFRETNHDPKLYVSGDIPSTDLATPHQSGLAAPCYEPPSAIVPEVRDAFTEHKGPHCFENVPYFCREKGLNRSAEACGGGRPHLGVCAGQWSMSIQVGGKVTEVATQTEVDSPSFVVARSECDESLPDKGDLDCVKDDLGTTNTSCALASSCTAEEKTPVIPTLKATQDRQLLTTPPPGTDEDPIDHQPSLTDNRNNCVSSAVPSYTQLHVLPVSNKQPPCIPSFFTERGCESKDARSYRERLEESIGRHGQLGQTIAKLQQQVQLAVRRPHQ